MSRGSFFRALNRCGKEITLQNRDIVAPLYGSVDFDEEFSNDIVVKAIIKTQSGNTFFDGVNTESNITHLIRIKYIEGVTSETWILFKGRRIDILSVENCCEDDEILILTCTDQGTQKSSDL